MSGDTRRLHWASFLIVELALSTMSRSHNPWADDQADASDGPSQDESEQEEEETKSDRDFMDDEEIEEIGPPVGNFQATLQLEAEDFESEQTCKACNGHKRAHTCGKKRRIRKTKPSAGVNQNPDVAMHAGSENNDVEQCMTSPGFHPVPGRGGGRGQGAGRGRGGGGMNDSEEERRELIPIEQKGLGIGSMCDRIERLSILTRPYFLQSMINKEGPWSFRWTKDWFDDKREQLRFAKLFSRPLFEEEAEEAQVLKNFTSRVLFTFCNTHEQTEIDVQVGELSDVCIPQFSGDRQSSLLLDGGPQGGMQGCHTAVLWKMNAESVSLATDPDIRHLGTQLAQASHGCDINGTMWYAPNTYFTDVKAGLSRHKCHSTARYYTSQDLNAVQDKSLMRTSNDLCPQTFAKIVSERSGRGEFELVDSVPDLEYTYDNELLIPQARAVNRLEMMNEALTYEEDLPHEHVEDSLYRIFIHTDIVTGVDLFGNPKKIRIDSLIIKMKMPGADVGQLLNCLRNSMSGLVLPLTNVLSHMALTMKINTNGVNLNQVFNPGFRNNISLLTAEAQMLPAVFNVAASNKIVNISFRGCFYDVNCSESCKVYRRMLEGVLHSRSQHYKIVSMGCNRDTRPLFKQQDTPMAGFGKSLNLYNGIHYVRFSKSWLESECELLLQQLMTDETIPELQRNFHQNVLEYHGMLLDGGQEWFLPVDGSISLNTGIIGLINTDLIPHYEKQPGKTHVCEPLLHMHMQCPLFDIWLRNNVECDNDPYSEFFRGPAAYRPVADLEWMTNNDATLSAMVLQLRKHINRVVQTSSLNHVDRRRLRQEELLRAYGQSMHPVHEQMQNTINSASLDSIANTLFTTLEYNIRSAVSAGEMSDLKNVEKAMKSLLEYKVHGTVSGAKWVRDYKRFFTTLDAQPGPHHGHEGIQVSEWLVRTQRELNLNLSWANMMLFESLEDTLIAQFCWQKKQWGGTLKVADMAHHLVVLKYTSKTTKNGRVPYIVDWKSPSAGIDSTIDKLGEVNSAFGEFESLSDVLKLFYASAFSRDLIAGHMTPLAMATWLGSGLALNADGSIDFAASTYREDAFLAGYITEHKKDQASSNASEDKAGTLEKYMGHSGKGSGTQERPWCTTRNQDSRSYAQFMNLPLAAMCGNRPDGSFPTSSLKGARFCVLASSVLCGMVGRCVMLLCLGSSLPAVVTSTPVQKATKRKLARYSVQEAEDKSPMKSITPTLVAGNLAYFSWRHMCRKIFPPVHRNMTLNYKSPGYVFRNDFRTLSRVWRSLTEDLRRPYMQDHDTASRTWYGVLVSSTAFPAWVKSIVGMAHMRAVSLAQPSLGRMIVPLNSAMNNTFACIHHTPISFHSQLEALYVFTTQKTLDLNSMILSCYALHVLGLQQNCPLHIIALVVQGHTLTKEQLQRYNAFCEFLMPLVTADCPGLVHSGYFKETSVENVLTFCEFPDPNFHDEINKLWQSRNQAILLRNKSVYLRPAVEVIAYKVPDEIKACMDVKKGSPGANKMTVDPFVCATSEDMIAHLWAQQHTEKGEADRTRLQNPDKPWHKLADWWNNIAVPGTRLAGQQRQITSDKYNVDFEPPFETGHYHNETIRNLGCAQGVTRHMLMMFGLPEDTTRHELITAILQPYMKERGIQTRKVPKERAWAVKILGDTSPCFRFGSMPYQKTALDHSTGVETVLGMDVVWFVIAQGLYANEWAVDATGSYTTVVHQRNMAGQAEALLSMMLHTQIDKASVPVVNMHGFISLGSQSGILSSNLKSESQARIFFDTRLSTDSWLLDHTRDDRNMLNFRMRDESKLIFLDLMEDCTRSLYYRSILEAGESSFKPDSLGLLPPFPPESTLHMQTHWGFYEQAYKCFYRTHSAKVSPGCNGFSTAMRVWAASVQSHSITFIPNMLTHCSVACVKELPCISYHNGFMFTLRINAINASVQIVPTSPSHATTDPFANSLHDQWVSLPLRGPRTFRLRDLGMIMCAGLVLRDSGHVEIELPEMRDIASNHILVPFMYFPLVCWRTVLHLQIIGEQMTTTEGLLRLVKVEEAFDFMKPRMVCTEAWRQVHPELPSMPANYTLHVVVSESGEETFWIRRVLCAESKQSQLFFYNHLAQLVFDLSTNSGRPSAFEVSHRTEWDTMVAGEYIFNPDEPESMHLFPLLKREDGLLFLRKYKVDDSTTNKLFEASCKANKWLKAALAVQVENAAELDRLRMKSTKANLNWDHAWSAMHEKCSIHDELVAVRKQQVEIALQALEDNHVTCTHEDDVLGEDPPRTLLATPHTGQLTGEHTLGVMMVNPAWGEYMHMGKYYVEFLSKGGRTGSVSMDFVQAANCMLREGQMIYINMNQRMYTELQQLYPALRLDHDEAHATLDEGDSTCQLQAYYLLGDSKITTEDSFATHSCMRVAIATRVDKIIVFVSLFAPLTLECNISFTRTDVLLVEALTEQEEGTNISVVANRSQRGTASLWL